MTDQPIDYRFSAEPPSQKPLRTTGFWVGLGCGVAISAIYWFLIAPRLDNTSNAILIGFAAYLALKVLLAIGAFVLKRRFFGIGMIASIPFIVMALFALCFGIVSVGGLLHW